MVEVVPAQVGEGGHVEDDGVDPVLGEGVGGHLHGHGVVTLGPELRQSALQVGGLRRGPLPGQGSYRPRWACLLRSRIERTRWVTVVLPLVPVTPTIRRDRDGWP